MTSFRNAAALSSVSRGDSALRQLKDENSETLSYISNDAYLIFRNDCVINSPWAKTFFAEHGYCIN
jgi:hypothetical protein